MLFLKKCFLSIFIIIGYAVLFNVAILPVALVYKFYPQVLFNGHLIERVRQWRKKCENSIEHVWSIN